MAAVPVDQADALAVAMLREFVDQATEHTPAELARARAALDQLAAGAGRYLTVADAAELLAVSPDTVRQMIAIGWLPAARLGYRTMRVPAAALAELTSTRPARESGPSRLIKPPSQGQTPTIKPKWAQECRNG